MGKWCRQKVGGENRFAALIMPPVQQPREQPCSESELRIWFKNLERCFVCGVWYEFRWHLGRSGNKVSENLGV